MQQAPIEPHEKGLAGRRLESQRGIPPGKPGPLRVRWIPIVLAHYRKGLPLTPHAGWDLHLGRATWAF